MIGRTPDAVDGPRQASFRDGTGATLAGILGRGAQRPADPAVRKANLRRILRLFRPYGRTLLAVNA